MREVVIAWYAYLSTFNSAVSLPIRDLADSLGVPVLSALLFGLIGATSPCQLTTNAGALAYLARSGGSGGSVAVNAVAYLIGKALVYTVAGMAVILVGRELAQSSIPVIVVARKALGPLMILLGLHLFGLVPLRFSVGGALADWLERRASGGVGGAFVLGTAFSFAFCPTLFLLFFGLTIPLALASPAGAVFPAAFALGTTVPLLGVATALAAGAGAARDYLGGARRIDAWVRPITAGVLVLAGLNDTIVSWLL